jgi:hypothetical protein
MASAASITPELDRARAFLSGRAVPQNDIYVLNHTTKFLARDNTDARHDFGHYQAGDPRASICEAWRFPIIDGHYNASDPAESYRWNEVTFVYYGGKSAPEPAEVSVVGTFAPLYEEIPLRRVPETPYFTVTVLVPKGELHTYLYVVDGEVRMDPVNPQETTSDNGVRWSRFFTQGCTRRISFEPWEMDILMRMTHHILPFRTAEGQRFLQQYYESLDRQSREQRYTGAYRFDESVGAANFIDKIVAREENHHLIDYKICLGEINRLLRMRNPFVEPRQISKEMYIELYDQMASGNVPGWNYDAYNNPRYFLQLLRRHTLTGAFAHPKYCGNSGASGWAYLSERYKDAETGNTLFDWRAAIEPPIGRNEHYRG